MAAAADRIVAVCGWLYDALLINGVPCRKLILNRQGVAHSKQFISFGGAKVSSDMLRLGFLGRWDPLKGVDLLVEAFMRLPKNLPVELHICGVVAGSSSRKYREDVQYSAKSDHRIRFLPAMRPERISGFFAEIDVLMVPSQWLETGPLVVLEAFAAGTPVIGSKLGGIKELVSHERDGLLVVHDDVSAWTSAMSRLVTDRALLDRLREGMSLVRTMSEVAHDMAILYQKLITADACAA
jgi:glycosyltransferase involved in cell wall biosynthesis